MLSLGEPLEMIVAVLHDAVQDGDLSLKELRGKGFPNGSCGAPNALMQRTPGEPYAEYSGRMAENPVAAAVKRADLRDTLGESHIPNPPDMDREGREKYRAALV